MLYPPPSLFFGVEGLRCTKLTAQLELNQFNGVNNCFRFNSLASFATGSQRKIIHRVTHIWWDFNLTTETL